MNKSLLLATLALPVLVTGCVTCATCVPANGAVAPAAAADPVAVALPVADSRSSVAKPASILATGYGAPPSGSYLSAAQQRLMAIRGARIDAYRNLAEQVYGFRVWGNSAVSSFAMQNDSVRTYVDSFIRGARLVNITPIGDGSYEATVELDLTPAFIQCVSAPRPGSRCELPAAPHDVSCANMGCAQPSGYYHTIY